MDFLKKAQKASHYEHGVNSDKELSNALSTGRLQAYILEGQCTSAVVGALVEGNEALLCMFYREGPKHGIFQDCADLWGGAQMFLGMAGVRKVALYVSMKNPNYKGLVKLYERFGFKQDMTRMAQVIL